MASSSPSSPLISTAELSALPDAPVLLDVRWRLGGPSGHHDYVAGHIPGASYVDMEQDLAAAPGRAGRHPLPSPDVFSAAMRRAGVSRTSHVIVYDDSSGLAAARAWWLLRHHGHPAVQVLDGGWAAWRSSGGAVASGEHRSKEGDFVAGPGGPDVVSAADLADFDGVLLDARAGERFRGEVEPIDPVAGHIPGAVSAPTTDNVGPDGRFLPAADLRARFLEVGVDPERPLAAYCGSGVTAAHELLALQVAGFSGALYPGSWSEWVADPSRPVATGA